MLVQIEGTANRTAVRPPLAVRQSHVFETAHGFHVLVVDGSRIYFIDERTADRLRSDPENTDHALERLGVLNPDSLHVSNEPPLSVPVRSLSLAVAQKCNLACSYCYAQEGSFGSEPKRMERATALRSVDMLFRGAKAGQDVKPGEIVNLAFLGGEPLINRALIRECTERAAETARRTGVRLNLSITTNGTLVTPDDGRFFEEHGFAVTISMDGIGETHDRQRPFRGGQGSYAKIVQNVRPLLVLQSKMQVSARVTITPGNLRLRETLDHLLDLGFHSVGFSPMLHAPSGSGEMTQSALSEMLAQMIECGGEFERRSARGERYAFANVATAIRELHKGTHRPYPCGAGGGYFGVSADGGLYACHRFVEDTAAYFGDVWSGVDTASQSQWLAQRHVHFQSPCSGCWARYLCGGGCHHEVIHRGRPACDYIRGWLDYCLKAYVRMRVSAPEYFV
jgi:uncharacterized protein